MRLAPGKPPPDPEDVPYELAGTVRRALEPSGKFRLLRRDWWTDPETGKRYINRGFWDGAPLPDFRSREEARLWCECAGIDFDEEVLENG